MTCDFLDLDNGRQIILCDRSKRPRKCRFCDNRATKQCDFKLTSKATRKTCDIYLCTNHAVQQGTKDGDTLDYCQPHHNYALKQAANTCQTKTAALQSSSHQAR